MCNFYNLRTNQQAVLDFARALRDSAGNLPPSLDVYPNTTTPIIRVGVDAKRELVRCRWGMPTPPKFVKGEVDRGVTNVRNTGSPHWRRWLGPESRCVVPATSFAEPNPVPDPETSKKGNVWFALEETQPLFWFAGIWTPWHGVRKKVEGPMDHELFAFLTCEPDRARRG